MHQTLLSSTRSYALNIIIQQRFFCIKNYQVNTFYFVDKKNAALLKKVADLSRQIEGLSVQPSKRAMTVDAIKDDPAKVSGV